MLSQIENLRLFGAFAAGAALSVVLYRLLSHSSTAESAESTAPRRLQNEPGKAQLAPAVSRSKKPSTSFDISERNNGASDYSAVDAALQAARLVHIARQQHREVESKRLGEIDAPPIVEKTLQGEIYLIGAGLGRPDMLTLEAVGILARADVVLSDRLVDESLRSLFRKDCEVLVAARKSKGRADGIQGGLNAAGLAALRAGKCVARLKIGDPLLYARGAEEVLFFRQHGFEPRFVAGLSSALTAPMLAGIPVTSRGVANQVLLTTGRDRGGGMPDLPRYSPTRTVVMLMGVGRLSTLESDLGAVGYPSTVPVAVVERAGLPSQRVTSAELG